MKKYGLLAIILLGFSWNVWSMCEYCEEFNSSVQNLQTCSGIGWTSCGNLYIYGRTACCSNTPGPACGLNVSFGSEYFIYKFTRGYSCNGIYKCTRSSWASCQGDFIVAASSSCVPFGIEYVELGTRIRCKY